MTAFALITLSKVTTDHRDAEEGAPERAEPTNINVNCIRAFYSRKSGKPGTRITFNDGGGFAVLESPDYVREAAMAVARGETQPPAPVIEHQPASADDEQIAQSDEDQIEQHR